MAFEDVARAGSALGGSLPRDRDSCCVNLRDSLTPLSLAPCETKGLVLKSRSDTLLLPEDGN